MLRTFNVFTPLFFLMAVFLMAGERESPDDVDREALAESKAAFVLNFVRYAEWPEEVFSDEESPITIVVLGDDPMTPHLRRMIAEELINERRIRLRRFNYPEPPPGQHDVHEQVIKRFHQRIQRANVLYFSATKYEYVSEILEVVEDQPILTVSDMTRFIRRGGMLGLIVRDDRVQFDANVSAMRARGLTMSSHVLRLARTVIDDEQEKQEEEAGR